MTPQEMAKAILKLYNGRPERWAQAVDAKDANGIRVPAEDPNAVCWCLAAAAGKVDPYNYHHYLNFVAEVKKQTKQYLTQFNDDPDTTFEKVCEVLRHVAAG